MELAFLGTINLLITSYTKINSNYQLKKAINEVVIFQEKQIRNISQDITSLRQGPMYSAKIYLQDATKKHRTEQESVELIIKAKEKLIDALGIIEAKTEKSHTDYYFIAFVRYCISLCWLLMRKKEDAIDWLIESIEVINYNRQSIIKENQHYQKIRNEITKSIEKLKVEEPNKGTLVAIALISPVVALKFLNNSSSKRKLESIELKVEENERILTDINRLNKILEKTKSLIN